MHRTLTTLAMLTILTACPTLAWSEFTQADRERMVQMFAKIEEVDKRLDDLREDTNQRFTELREDMNKRLEEQRTDTNQRLTELREDMNKRLEEQRTDTNQRFTELREDMNARFAQVDKRFEQVNNQFTTLTNLMMAIIGAFVAIVVMAISLALWDRRTMVRPVEEKMGKLEKLLVDHVEPRLQEVEGKVETVATQSAQAEAGRRKRMRDALDDLQSRGGDDARLAGVLRGLL